MIVKIFFLFFSFFLIVSNSIAKTFTVYDNTEKGYKEAQKASEKKWVIIQQDNNILELAKLTRKKILLQL